MKQNSKQVVGVVGDLKEIRRGIEKDSNPTYKKDEEF